MHRQTFFVTISLYIYIYISVTAPARAGGGGGGGRGGGRGGGGEGGEGAEGGKGGRGGEGGRGEENTRILVLPSHRQPKSIGGGETSPRTLGLIYGFTQREPPPPHNGPLRGGRGGD